MSRRCGDAYQQTLGRERVGRMAPARGCSRQASTAQRAPARGAVVRPRNRPIPAAPERGSRQVSRCRVPAAPARGSGRQVPGFQPHGQVERWESKFSHVDSRTGSYEHTTTTNEVSTGRVFRETASGPAGYGDELKTTKTVRVGDRSGYDEFKFEKSFRRVNFRDSDRRGMLA